MSRCTRLTTSLVALLACWAPAALAQAAHDSAGIHIVENTKPAWTAGHGWKLSAEPALDINGGTGEGALLGRIGSATRLSDGRLVIGDAESMQLKFFDASGKLLRSAGGKGRNPGEFLNFGAVRRLAGDSLVVDAPRVASMFAPNGAFVRAVPSGPFPGVMLETPFVSPLGHFNNGTTIVADFPQGSHRPAGAARWVDSASLMLVNASGALERPLGRLPIVVFVAGDKHPSTLDFGPAGEYATNGRAFYYGFSNQYAVNVYNTDFKLERIIRRSWTPRAMTSADIDTYVDGWMAMWSKKTGPERDAERQEMRADAYPEFLPAYGTMLASPDGTLWLREPELYRIEKR